MKTMAVTLIAFCLAGIPIHAQETLREVARRQKGAVEFRVMREFSPVDLLQLIKSSDLIARAVVTDNGRSYLSKDERSIYSEFTVQVLDRFLSTPDLKLADKILVTIPGGTMTIEGYPITSRESDLPPFQANEEYVLFLKFDASTGQYLLPYGAQGAFRSIAGEIEQVSKDTGTWNRNKGRMPVLAFIQELTRVLNQP
jgi:hypothetical protein